MVASIVLLLMSLSIVRIQSEVISFGMDQFNKSVIEQIDQIDFILDLNSESPNFDHCQIFQNYSRNHMIVSTLDKKQKVKYLDCRDRHHYLNAMYEKITDDGSLYRRDLGKGVIPLYPEYYSIKDNHESVSLNCLKLPEVDVIIELVCSFPWYSNRYHTFLDCWIPNIQLVELAVSLIKRKQRVRVIVPFEKHLDLFKIHLSLLDQTIDYKNYIISTPSKCISVLENTNVIFEARSFFYGNTYSSRCN